MDSQIQWRSDRRSTHYKQGRNDFTHIHILFLRGPIVEQLPFRRGDGAARYAKSQVSRTQLELECVKRIDPMPIGNRKCAAMTRLCALSTIYTRRRIGMPRQGFNDKATGAAVHSLPDLRVSRAAATYGSCENRAMRR